MKQNVSNACGTVGLLHCLGNQDLNKFTNDSWTKKIVQVYKSPEERGLMFAKDGDIKAMHEKVGRSQNTRLFPFFEFVIVEMFCFSMFLCSQMINFVNFLFLKSMCPAVTTLLLFRTTLKIISSLSSR